MARGLTTIIVAEFRDTFEERYVPETSKYFYLDEFRWLYKANDTVQIYLTKFNELAMFSLEK